MKNATNFTIVRHGETVWNTQKIMQGHGDSPLTLTGQKQALALGQEFADIHFDYVFSSDLLRAQRTAELITIEKKLAVNTTALLRERSFGKYEGKSREEFELENKDLFREYGKLNKDEQWKFKYGHDMESNEEVMGRLLTFLREIAVTYPGKNILAVTHGGALRVLLAHLGKTVAGGRDTIANMAYVKLLSDGVEFEIKETKGIQLEAKLSS